MYIHVHIYGISIYISHIHFIYIILFKQPALTLSILYCFLLLLIKLLAINIYWKDTILLTTMEMLGGPVYQGKIQELIL